MKLSDYIKQLEKVKELHGDNELHFQVRDYYSRYGEDASFMLNTDSWTWNNVRTVDGHTTLIVNLKEKDGKNPKITFRK